MFHDFPFLRATGDAMAGHMAANCPPDLGNC